MYIDQIHRLVAIMIMYILFRFLLAFRTYSHFLELSRDAHIIIIVLTVCPCIWFLLFDFTQILRNLRFSQNCHVASFFVQSISGNFFHCISILVNMFLSRTGTTLGVTLQGYTFDLSNNYNISLKKVDDELNTLQTDKQTSSRVTLPIYKNAILCVSYTFAISCQIFFYEASGLQLCLLSVPSGTFQCRILHLNRLQG